MPREQEAPRCKELDARCRVWWEREDGLWIGGVGTMWERGRCVEVGCGVDQDDGSEVQAEEGRSQEENWTR